MANTYFDPLTGVTKTVPLYIAWLECCPLKETNLDFLKIMKTEFEFVPLNQKERKRKEEISLWDDTHITSDCPQHIEIKITNRCNMGCPMCFEASNPNGNNCSMESLKFLDSWSAGRKVTLTGGCITLHPQIEKILEKLNEKNTKVYLMLHQKEFLSHIEELKRWQQEGLIYGIGLSVGTMWSKKLTEACSAFKHLTIYAVVGLADVEILLHVGRELEQKAELVLLGYKKKGRGNDYEEKHAHWMKMARYQLTESLPWIEPHYQKIIYDEQATKQLKIRENGTLYKRNESERISFKNSIYVDAVRHRVSIDPHFVKQIRYTNDTTIQEMTEAVFWLKSALGKKYKL